MRLPALTLDSLVELSAHHHVTSMIGAGMLHMQIFGYSLLSYNVQQYYLIGWTTKTGGLQLQPSSPPRSSPCLNPCW